MTEIRETPDMIAVVLEYDGNDTLWFHLSADTETSGCDHVPLHSGISLADGEVAIFVSNYVRPRSSGVTCMMHVNAQASHSVPLSWLRERGNASLKIHVGRTSNAFTLQGMKYEVRLIPVVTPSIDRSRELLRSERLSYYRIWTLPPDIGIVRHDTDLPAPDLTALQQYGISPLESKYPELRTKLPSDIHALAVVDESDFDEDGLAAIGIRVRPVPLDVYSRYP